MTSPKNPHFVRPTRVTMTAILWLQVFAMLLVGCSQSMTRFDNTPPTTRKDPIVSPPGGGPSLDEEVWIISRGSAKSAQNEVPSGALLAQVGLKTVAVPLKHTEVDASIQGYIANVSVTQQFQNPYKTKIDATYLFPLPENAAVNEFIMTIGKRRIRGIIRDRAEARAMYERAKSQGYVVSLLTQERPNVFTQKVANIEPGKAVDVNIKYFHTLACRDGWYEFVYPMVVAPRYHPQPDDSQTDRRLPMPVAKAAPPQPVGPQFVSATLNAGNQPPLNLGRVPRSGHRSGHDINMKVSVNAGVPIEQVSCQSHAVSIDGTGSSRSITLNRNDRLPNKDFVLRYRVAGNRIHAGLLRGQDRHGSYVALMLHPPSQLRALPRKPLEMIFVVDCSGSMRGPALSQAKSAVRHALGKLTPQDSFQIIQFSNRASRLGTKPLIATSSNIQRGVEYLTTLRGTGGTEMLSGVFSALRFEHDPKRHRVVTFLTDGRFSEETQILAAIHRDLGAARVFSFGLGSSPNRYLLNRMAKIGRGAVAYIGLRDNPRVVMDAYLERVSHPAMTDIKVTFEGSSVEAAFPKRIPDLFTGRPVIVAGKVRGKLTGRVRVTGQAGGQQVEFVIPVDQAVGATGNRSGSSLSRVWARMRIADLADEAAIYPHRGAAITRSIRSVAMDYGLMSAFTAFVAVDARSRTGDGPGKPMIVPLPLPEGSGVN